MRIVPVLFATDMVRALLKKRKSVTRRVLKPQPLFYTGRRYVFADDVCPKKWEDCDNILDTYQYKPGDILYVRETFRLVDFNFIDGDWSANVQYRADMAVEERLHYLKHGEDERFGWRPSIYMPKEAARIFLKVKSVRVERLQDITEDGAVSEGVVPKGGNFALDDFESLWNGTIKPADRDKCSWDANPWVWVIEFERAGKPERWPGVT